MLPVVTAARHWWRHALMRVDTSAFRHYPSVMAIEMRRKHLGDQLNEGARLAWAEMERRGWDQSRLRAEILKQTELVLGSGSLVKYLYCDRRPGLVWADAFFRVLGVPVIAWATEPTVAFEPPAAQDAPADQAKTGTDGE